MFCAADIEIDGQPVFFLLRGDRRLAIIWIGKAQIIPARACPLRHRVGLPQRCQSGGRIDGTHPIGRSRQWGITVSVGL